MTRRISLFYFVVQHIGIVFDSSRIHLIALSREESVIPCTYSARPHSSYSIPASCWRCLSVPHLQLASITLVLWQIFTSFSRLEPPLVSCSPSPTVQPPTLQLPLPRSLVSLCILIYYFARRLSSFSSPSTPPPTSLFNNSLLSHLLIICLLDHYK